MTTVQASGGTAGALEFVKDAEVEHAVEGSRTPARALVRELLERPGVWARVPESVSTAYLRQIKTYSEWFGRPLEIRIVSEEERWARAVSKAGTRARRMQKRGNGR